MKSSPNNSYKSAIRFFNTLSGLKEVFTPIQENRVKLYVCGITPYDESHLGHARCYVFFDTVRRIFEKCGYEVFHVQNFTDIDDKIIARSQATGKPQSEIAEKFIEEFFHKMEMLNVKKARAYPRVTQTLPQIINFVQKLIDSGHAYIVEGSVYFSVRKFGSYGKLSKRNLDEMEAGARVEVDEKKNDPLDFALWKRAKSGEPSWAAPWGAGRPGWHIECSVMSTEHLGETFDIHGGGQDLIFPHHENEIAQSECVSGQPFVRYWLHNGFVTVNREKMSKSLGNFFTLREIFEKYTPEVVRLFLLSRHYRTPLDFSDDLLQQAQSSYYSLQDAYETCHFLLADSEGLENSGDDVSCLEDWEKKFMDAVTDDFNTEKALAVVFQLRNQMVDKINERDLAWLRTAQSTLAHFCSDILGFNLKSRLSEELIRTLREKLKTREECRKKKDWGHADHLRQEIESEGFLIEDSAKGSVVRSKHVI